MSISVIVWFKTWTTIARILSREFLCLCYRIASAKPLSPRYKRGEENPCHSEWNEESVRLFCKYLTDTSLPVQWNFTLFHRDVYQWHIFATYWLIALSFTFLCQACSPLLLLFNYSQALQPGLNYISPSGLTVNQLQYHFLLFAQL